MLTRNSAERLNWIRNAADWFTFGLLAAVTAPGVAVTVIAGETDRERLETLAGIAAFSGAGMAVLSALFAQSLWEIADRSSIRCPDCNLALSKDYAPPSDDLKLACGCGYGGHLRGLYGEWFRRPKPGEI